MPTIKLLVDGGSMSPGPAVGQQLGPLGINIGEVISKVNEATSEFKGMKVPAVLNIDAKTKQFTVEVSSPPTAELLKKELSLEKGSGEHKKVTVANASIEDVIKVTKIKYPNMLSKDFKSAVKSIVGTCASIGILVENKEAVDLMEDIDKGVFDKEINDQVTETSPEKRAKLKKHFDTVVKEQQAAIKAEEEAKAAEEDAKAEAAAEGAEEGAEAPAEGAEAAPEGGEAAPAASGAGGAEGGEAPAEEPKSE